MIMVRERPWATNTSLSYAWSALKRELCLAAGPPHFRPWRVVTQDERPVTIQDTWRLVQRGLGHTTRISQSVLTVGDFETVDAGYYICTAQNLRGQTTVATTVEFS